MNVFQKVKVKNAISTGTVMLKNNKMEIPRYWLDGYYVTNNLFKIIDGDIAKMLNDKFSYNFLHENFYKNNTLKAEYLVLDKVDNEEESIIFEKYSMIKDLKFFPTNIIKFITKDSGRFVGGIFKCYPFLAYNLAHNLLNYNIENKSKFLVLIYILNDVKKIYDAGISLKDSMNLLIDSKNIYDGGYITSDIFYTLKVIENEDDTFENFCKDFISLYFLEHIKVYRSISKSNTPLQHSNWMNGELFNALKQDDVSNIDFLKVLSKLYVQIYSCKKYKTNKSPEAFNRELYQGISPNELEVIVSDDEDITKTLNKGRYFKNMTKEQFKNLYELISSNELKNSLAYIIDSRIYDSNMNFRGIVFHNRKGFKKFDVSLFNIYMSNNEEIKKQKIIFLNFVKLIYKIIKDGKLFIKKDFLYFKDMRYKIVHSNDCYFAFVDIFVFEKSETIDDYYNLEDLLKDIFNILEYQAKFTIIDNRVKHDVFSAINYFDPDFQGQFENYVIDKENYVCANPDYYISSFLLKISDLQIGSSMCILKENIDLYALDEYEEDGVKYKDEFVDISIINIDSLHGFLNDIEKNMYLLKFEVYNKNINDRNDSYTLCGFIRKHPVDSVALFSEEFYKLYDEKACLKILSIILFRSQRMQSIGFIKDLMQSKESFPNIIVYNNCDIAVLENNKYASYTTNNLNSIKFANWYLNRIRKDTKKVGTTIENFDNLSVTFDDEAWYQLKSYINSLDEYCDINKFWYNTSQHIKCPICYPNSYFLKGYYSTKDYDSIFKHVGISTDFGIVIQKSDLFCVVACKDDNENFDKLHIFFNYDIVDFTPSENDIVIRESKNCSIVGVIINNIPRSSHLCSFIKYILSSKKPINAFSKDTYRINKIRNIGYNIIAFEGKNSSIYDAKIFSSHLTRNSVKNMLNFLIVKVIMQFLAISDTEFYDRMNIALANNQKSKSINISNMGITLVKAKDELDSYNDFDVDINSHDDMYFYWFEDSFYKKINFKNEKITDTENLYASFVKDILVPTFRYLMSKEELEDMMKNKNNPSYIANTLNKFSAHMQNCKICGTLYNDYSYKYCPKCFKDVEGMEIVDISKLPQKPMKDGGEANIYDLSKKEINKIYKKNSKGNYVVDITKKSKIVFQWLKIKDRVYREISDEKFKLVLPIRVTITHKNKEFTGYVMEKINNAKSISILSDIEYAQKNKLKKEDILKILINIAKSLEYLKINNWYIGDFNGGNILFDKTGKIYIIDVDSMGGIAGNKPIAFVETYLDPEANWHGDTANVSISTDYYSFAIIAFSSLTGLHPFGGIYRENGKIVNNVERMKRKISVLSKDKNIIIPKTIFPWDWMCDELKDAFYKIFEGKMRENILPYLEKQLELIKSNNSSNESDKDTKIDNVAKEDKKCSVNIKLESIFNLKDIASSLNIDENKIYYKDERCYLYYLNDSFYLYDKVHDKTSHLIIPTEWITNEVKVAFTSDDNYLVLAEQKYIYILALDSDFRCKLVYTYNAMFGKTRGNATYFYTIDNSGNYVLNLLRYSKSNKDFYLYKDLYTENSMPLYFKMSPNSDRCYVYYNLNYEGDFNLILIPSGNSDQILDKVTEKEFKISNADVNIKAFIDEYSEKKIVIYVKSEKSFYFVDSSNFISKSKINIKDSDTFLRSVEGATYYNNIIYYPSDGKICAINMKKGSTKEFKCSCCNENSIITRIENGFIIRNKDEIFEMYTA